MKKSNIKLIKIIGQDGQEIELPNGIPYESGAEIGVFLVSENGQRIGLKNNDGSISPIPIKSMKVTQ